MQRDVLAGKPARPSTPAPGHWLIDLPCLSPRVHVRCYTSLSPLSQDGSVDTILSNAGAEPLERAWKQVNEREVGFDKGVAGILEGGCALIVATQSGRRELWCFIMSRDGDALMNALENTEGLQEITVNPGSFQPADLVDCRKHGHDTACLATQGSTEKACDLRMTSNEDVRRWWAYLGDAVYEKLSWRNGKRVPLRTGDPASRPIEIGLHPMPHDKLLFTVMPRSPPSYSYSGQQASPHLLEPLGLPALLLGPRPLSLAQDLNLSSLFKTALGHAWEAGRSNLKLDSQIHRHPYSDWSVCWVPIIPSVSLSDEHSWKPSIWREGQGVVTIWPTHLARDLSTGDHHITRLRTAAPATNDFPQDADLLSTATNLFEYLTSIQDHQTSPTNLTTQVITPMDTVDDDSPPFEYDDVPVLPDSPSREESGSDVDDLFSAGSESPGPPEPLEDVEEVPVPPLQTDVPMGNDKEEKELLGRVDMNDDVDMASPPSRYDFPAIQSTSIQEEANMVTEDDFDFFDSPKPDLPIGDTILDQQIGPDLTGFEREPTLADSEDLFGDEDIAITEGDGNAVQPELALGNVAGLVLIADTVDDVDAEVSNSSTLPLSPASEGVNLAVVNARAVETSLRDPVNTQQTDIIPSDFGPIELSPSNPIHTFAPYAPPTPAPTPPGLRPSLLARLQPPKIENLDYAADWEISSAESETEEEDEGYAPPTPISEMDSEDDVPVNDVSAKVKGGSKKGDEVEWEGIRCVGAEWVVIRDQREVLEKSARPWNNSWEAADNNNGYRSSTLIGEMAENKRSLEALERLDLDKFAIEVLSNRSLRQTIIADKDTRPMTGLDVSLAEAGVDLAVLNGLGPETSKTSIYHPHSLPECLVHVGYANYVMQLMTSGLRYWKELGLQPVGGKKGVTGLVVCGLGEGNARAAKTFLTRMSMTFEGHRLGTHRVGETPGAKEGVLSLPENAFVDSITGILSRNPENTVIYLLLTNFKPTLFEALQRLPPIPKTAFIHLVTASDLQHRNLSVIAMEIYDRVPVPIHPITNMPASDITHLPQPHFTLAPDEPPKVEFTLQWPIRNYEILNKWRWIHCAYTVDWEMGLGVGFMVDENGEGWEVRVWKGVGEGKGFVERVWEWMEGVAKGWAVEWRVSVCRLGGMRSDENAAWMNILSSKRLAITLLIAEHPTSVIQPHSPRPPIANAPPAIYADSTTKINDDSLSTQTFAYSFRTPISLLPSPSSRQTSECIIPKTAFLLSTASPQGGGDYGSTKYHVLHHRPALEREEENVESVLAREFHKLTCLGRGRFGFEGYLPGHLEAVRMIVVGLKAYAEFS